MPVNTRPHLLLVGAGNPITVPCLARLGVMRGEIRRLLSADQQLPGSLSTEGYYLHTSVKISRSAIPIFLFKDGFSMHTLMSTGETCL
jgi:hypothetical protein